ncbi:MAG: DUF1249 domain-containing protein [Gammaproteobacteria bacterium]|nr:DUF1249 domain-containing protein [Gammaproteobacteria bacterium]
MMHPFLIAKRKRRNITVLHEANFRKLARVVPSLLELEIATTVQDANGMQLSLHILETSKYTKTFSLQLQHSAEQPWLPGLHMKIRNYYDAGVTEVLAFQHKHRLNSRYSYPNRNMFQRNEKWQINQFLGEWLDYCLRTDCIFHVITEPLDS